MQCIVNLCIISQLKRTHARFIPFYSWPGAYCTCNPILGPYLLNQYLPPYERHNPRSDAAYFSSSIPKQPVEKGAGNFEGDWIRLLPH
jgi:hypothetical protein